MKGMMFLIMLLCLALSRNDAQEQCDLPNPHGGPFELLKRTSEQIRMKAEQLGQEHEELGLMEEPRLTTELPPKSAPPFREKMRMKADELNQKQKELQQWEKQLRKAQRRGQSASGQSSIG
jgi:hypothetical protein